MKAVLYEKFQGPMTLENVDDPTPPADGVVLKVRSTGLCLSDWHGWMGHDTDIRLPHVPGHELAGEIVAVGRDITKFKIGERVTVPFVGGCGHCMYCKNGDHQVCDNQFQPGFTHWGSFAEYVSIHYADINLVRLPDAISDVTAASLGCRFATSFRAVVDQAKVTSGQWVVVHGCGGVGLSAIMIAKALGARVIAVDISEAALKMAAKLGTERTVSAQSSKETIAHIMEITKGGAHVSIDAIGNPQVLVNSISCLRKRGKHVQVGLMNAEDSSSEIPVDKIVARELEILGSHGIQAYRYEEILKMIAEKKLRPEQLVSQTISLSEALERLPKMPFSENQGITVITEFS